MNMFIAWNNYVIAAKTMYSKGKPILGHNTNNFG